MFTLLNYTMASVLVYARHSLRVGLYVRKNSNFARKTESYIES